MGFLEWMGFSKPRDAPEEDRPEENRTKENLPEVTDSVRDSGQIFSFGTASSGEKVDEQSAMQASLEHDDGNGEESFPKGISCPHMGAPDFKRGDCGLWCLCLCKKGYCRLYVFENPVCIL